MNSRDCLIREEVYTQLCQQLVNSLYDVRLESHKMLPEVFFAESSRGQQLVQRFLLVRLLGATLKPAKEEHPLRHTGSRGGRPFTFSSTGFCSFST